MQPRSAWRELYDGGDPEAERLVFAELSRSILDVQLKLRKRSGASEVQRAFHAKSVLGVANAELRVVHDIPPGFIAGYFQPGASYAATVRLSNANGTPRPDHVPDMRGAAVRIKVSEAEQHDLLMTNFPVAHARNARQFVAFAQAMAGPKLLLVPRLLWRVGLPETIRMLRNVSQAASRPIRSVALETYWSRGPILWGESPVRYLLRPAVGAAGAPEPSTSDPEYLHREVADRLRGAEVSFDLCIQPFVDEAATPIEDGAVEWTETASPPLRVATLTIPRQDIDAADGRATQRLVDQIAFNPWHTTEQFRPLGNLNRARKAVYRASSAHRLAYQFRETIPLRNLLCGRAAGSAFRVVNRFREWHRLGLHLGLLNLSLYRDELRQKNLLDTQPREAPPTAVPVPSTIPEHVRTARTYDGSYNDLSDPEMGAAGRSTFGRNMPPIYRPTLLDVPNPITVSRELLFREAFVPARSLNLLAACWIQFQVHDWVDHDRHRLGENDVIVPVPGEGTWQNSVGGAPERQMRIAGNRIFCHSPEGHPLFANMTSPWWDGSEVYGQNEASAKTLRDGAYIRLTHDGYLPHDVQGKAVTGFNQSWWLGLSLMHTLFAREHNVLCDELKRAYPAWSDERVYQTARLVVSALIAKIHTIEWTPAILATKTIDAALRANWYGAPKDWLTQLAIWLLDTHALKGIPQTLPDHHAAPYSLTEEFASVYRLHPLIPDDYQFRDHRDGSVMENRNFSEIQGSVTDDEMRRLRLSNVLYSFGIAHPGAITLHNYPRALQRFERDGELIDLSVVDIVRDRARGVPRFNDFRQGLHRPPVRGWDELSSDPETARKLKDLYGTIDRVDTMVGLFAERPPEGFGFSDTAFRVFLLMASRRLQSDRFLTVDFRPEVYSPLGLDWIANNGMTSIILRHCPQLASVLPRNASAFAPFRPIVS
jgi:hypothetical protein